MAAGSWKYVGYRTNPHSGSAADVLAMVTAWKGYLVTNLAPEGWSLHADVTVYNTSLQWFAIEHSGGARVVFIHMGDTGTTGQVMVEASNEIYNSTQTSSSHENTWWVAYIQPHLQATALVGDPDTAGFLPSGSLKFTSMWGRGEPSTSAWGEPFGLHVGVRGGNMWFAVGADIDNDPEVDTVCLMGECLDRIAHENHSTEPDNHTDSKYANVCWDSCAYDATVRVQFFNAAGDYRTTSSQSYASELLTDNVCDREPWTWQVPTFYVSSSDLDSDGVVTGNGIKGSINPEWFRYVMLPGGPANDKQRLDAGDFIYLRAGMSIGWDPGNGSML